MTIKRVISFIILVPVAVVLIAFIVANRTWVRLALNPFAPDESSLSFTAPFFVWLFVFLAIGILIGSITTWFSQHKHRKAMRELQTELQACHTQLHQEQHKYDIA